MEHAYDVVVIGAGCAGTAAALAAAAAGARTAIVAASPGASALSAGGWRGVAPEPFLAALADAGLPVHPVAGALPHPFGDVRRFDAAAESHAGGTPRDLAVVAGIAGLPGFRAAALARLWGDASGVALRATTLHLGGTPRAGWAIASLAAAVERDPSLLADPLRAEARRNGASLVIVPAVLGAAAWRRVRAAVEDAVAATVVEALGTAPSLPGLRLDGALRIACTNAGVQRIDGRVTDRVAGRSRLDSVMLAIPHGPQVVVARAWVLATGRFTGGGIVALPDWREPVLDTPLSVEYLGTRFRRLEPLVHSEAKRTARQRWMETGVLCDDAMRPIAAGDPDGGPAFDNVFAAGAVVAGEAPGHGDAAAAGWQAGLHAAVRAAA